MSVLRALSGRSPLGPIGTLISFKGFELLVLPRGFYGYVISTACTGLWRTRLGPSSSTGTPSRTS
eukprot:1799686-Pyramimonas_sp.AAC.1